MAKIVEKNRFILEVDLNTLALHEMSAPQLSSFVAVDSCMKWNFSRMPTFECKARKIHGYDGNEGEEKHALVEGKEKKIINRQNPFLPSIFSQQL